MADAIGTACVLVLAAVCCGAAQAGTDDFRCLKTTDARRPLRLEFRFPADEGKAGQVRYEHGSVAIPVRLVSREKAEMDPGRPYEFTTVWREQPAGGTYTLVTQGARVYGARYVRADGRTFAFTEDLDAVGDDGCTWTR
ncbi:hypothetical protein [uncultured Massilia sp.]|uniref:hypothetical protein n=1 Tax=uncultured Massilia sp. TaxID=169973 RepID=UPI0025F60101|nr:hypothetical protein [uncultured Massilia sp.]